MLNSFVFRLERPCEGSFQRLTRLRDDRPIPARLTPLMDLPKEDREPRFNFRHCSPFHGRSTRNPRGSLTFLCRWCHVAAAKSNRLRRKAVGPAMYGLGTA